MTAEEILRRNEWLALREREEGQVGQEMEIFHAYQSEQENKEERDSQVTNNHQFKVNVRGRTENGNRRGRLATMGATGFIILVFLVVGAIFSAGNLIPTAISERLVEETDVQYADLVESKKIVLQQALREGNIPKDTAEILKSEGYIVGYGNGEGFVEANQANQALSIKHGDEIITAENFVAKMGSDPGLYAAVQEATYDRAAAYYDEAAQGVFKEIGTKRNNFKEDESLEEAMQRVMGEGSAVNINSVAMVEKSETDEDGNTRTWYEPETLGENASSAAAQELIEQVRQKNPAGTAEESAVNAGDTLKVADSVAKDQRSSLFFALFMENISKMKAGDGNESKINDVMNFLTTGADNEVVDVQTGNKKTVSGSPLEAPSLYALLAGENADKGRVADYSSERVLKTVRNLTATSDFSPSEGTVASVEDKVKGSIGRFVEGGQTVADAEVLAKVSPMIEESLVENGYETLSGVKAGEFLAEGAVNLNRRLAKMSGASAGDEGAAKEYARVSETVLAMEAKVDRMERSPFDITSKNTFLGSLMYKMATMMAVEQGRGILGTGTGVIEKIATGVKTTVNGFASLVSDSVASLAPVSLADDSNSGYMTDFGECETTGRIGAVATAGCAEIAVFDTSTLNDPFNNPEFVEFLEKNTELSGTTRKVKAGSDLADYIENNVGRKTPIGVMDGGILEALSGGGGEIPFISDILAMIQQWLGASEEDKRIASGEAFVDSGENQDWGTYKYAQRYVALARATAMLKENSSDATAYAEMKYFEGSENPVLAYLHNYQLAKE